MEILIMYMYTSSTDSTAKASPLLAGSFSPETEDSVVAVGTEDPGSEAGAFLPPSGSDVSFGEADGKGSTAFLVSASEAGE